MNAKNIVLNTIGQLTEQGATWFVKEGVTTVRATVDLRTELTGVVIPQGTIGRILEAGRDSLIIDFGLATVHRLPRDTHLIEVSR
ncbi:MAG: hypothetical protein KDJ97_35185 [Anaerolineae bacterium]|nr:hypothetical protein [Anaerolineae bacterium]